MFRNINAKTTLMNVTTLFVAILCIGTALGVFFLYQSVNGYNNYRNVITVSATGEVFGEPDISEISFTLKHEDKDVALAQESLSIQSRDVIDSLSSLNISEEDIKTTNYSSHPKYVWVPNVCEQAPCHGGSNEIDGFEVSQTILIKVRNLDDTSSVLKVLGENNIFNMYGPNFKIEDKDSLKELAVAEAIGKAKIEAQKRADMLGVELGKIIDYSESDNGFYPDHGFARSEMMMMDPEESFVSSASPVLPTGQNTVTATVYITYKIR